MIFPSSSPKLTGNLHYPLSTADAVLMAMSHVALSISSARGLVWLTEPQGRPVRPSLSHCVPGVMVTVPPGMVFNQLHIW